MPREELSGLHGHALITFSEGICRSYVPAPTLRILGAQATAALSQSYRKKGRCLVHRSFMIDLDPCHMNFLLCDMNGVDAHREKC